MSIHNRTHYAPRGTGGDEIAEKRLHDAIADADRVIAQRDRREDQQARLRRFQALRQMGNDTIGHGIAGRTTARMLTDLREDYRFSSLGPTARGEWERLAGEVVPLFREGSRGTAWQRIEDLAQEQAASLTTWEPPDAPAELSAAELAAKVPRW